MERASYILNKKFIYIGKNCFLLTRVDLRVCLADVIVRALPLGYISLDNDENG